MDSLEVLDPERPIREEKHDPARDIDTALMDSLEVLDPERPIREADIVRPPDTSEKCHGATFHFGLVRSFLPFLHSRRTIKRSKREHSDAKTNLRDFASRASNTRI